MRLSTSGLLPIYRSLFGCGFLLLIGRHPTWAQRETELQLSGGASLTQPGIRRYNLPRNFRTHAGFNTAAALRFTYPLSTRLGIGVEQRVTGLNQNFKYRLGNGQQSVGILSHTVHQSGASLRLYDLWTPGPQWSLDLALTGSYGWTSGGDFIPYEGPVLYSLPASLQPRPGVPIILAKETNRRGAPMLGLEMLLRYEWGQRSSLLLTAAYQRGIWQLGELRSTLVSYLDETGSIQQGGRFVVSSYASYGTVQLGYGLRLGLPETPRARHATPRYSIPGADDDASEESPIN